MLHFKHLCFVQVLTDEQMQQTAAEMNQPITAFVSLDEGDFVTGIVSIVHHRIKLI